MMKKTGILSIFLFCFFTSMAQVAGYKGCRLSVGYSGNISPAMLSPLAKTSMSENSEPNQELLFNWNRLLGFLKSQS